MERLSLVSIISSALAAALTAGPALGGQGFTDSVAGAFNTGEDSTVWRVLCLLTLVVSVISAIAVNLSKSRNWEARIISAEACNAELEGLQTLLEFGQIPVNEGREDVPAVRRQGSFRGGNARSRAGCNGPKQRLIKKLLRASYSSLRCPAGWNGNS